MSGRRSRALRGVASAGAVTGVLALGLTTVGSSPSLATSGGCSYSVVTPNIPAPCTTTTTEAPTTTTEAPETSTTLFSNHAAQTVREFRADMPEDAPVITTAPPAASATSAAPTPPSATTTRPAQSTPRHVNAASDVVSVVDEVVLVGTGYEPGSLVTAEVAGLPLASAVVAPDGTFTMRGAVPSGVVGPSKVTVRGNALNQAAVTDDLLVTVTVAPSSTVNDLAFTG